MKDFWSGETFIVRMGFEEATSLAFWLSTPMLFKSSMKFVWEWKFHWPVKADIVLVLMVHVFLYKYSWLYLIISGLVFFVFPVSLSFI